MRPITIREFRPQATVTIHTTRGVSYTYQDMAEDLVSLQVSRDTSGDAGQFTLNLTARQYPDGTWADRIEAMDYVEVRAGNLGASRYPDGKLPIRMRGFVDAAQLQFAIPQDGGPQRAVVMTGRDYTKLLMVSQIQYLWTTNLPSSLLNSATGMGLSANYGVPAGITTVRAFAEAVLQHIFAGTAANPEAAAAQPFLPLFRKHGVDAPDLSLSCTVPDRFQISLFTVQPYTGSLWNLFTYFQSPPIGEAFVYDSESSPVLVMRVAPFLDASGAIVAPAQTPELDPVTLSTDLVSQIAVGRSDDEVVNYFFVYSDMASTGAGSAFSYTDPGSVYNTFYQPGTTANPVWNQASSAKYGFRPLNVDSPWVLPITNANFLDNAEELAQYLAATQGHNEALFSGAAVVHGDESLVPGRYVTVKDEDGGPTRQFYLESVTDTFLFKGSDSPTWTAQLSLSRGMTA